MSAYHLFSNYPKYAPTPSAPPMYPPLGNPHSPYMMPEASIVEPEPSNVESGDEVIPIADIDAAYALTARGAAAMNPKHASYARMNVNELSSNSNNRYASLSRNKSNKRGFTYTKGPSTFNERELQRMRANTLNGKKVFNDKKKWYKFWGGKKGRKTRKAGKTRNKSRRPRV